MTPNELISSKSTNLADQPDEQELQEALDYIDAIAQGLEGSRSIFRVSRNRLAIRHSPNWVGRVR